MNQAALYHVQWDTYADVVPSDSRSQESSTSTMNQHQVNH